MGDHVDAFIASATGKGLDLAARSSSSGESERDLAQRFLKARKMNLVAALEMLEADVKWRERENIDLLTSQSIKSIVGVDEDVMWTYYPIWLQGFDKAGRPVMYSACEFPNEFCRTEMGHRCCSSLVTAPDEQMETWRWTHSSRRAARSKSC